MSSFTSRIYPVSKKRRRVEPTSFASLEERGIRLPTGYREFIETFGVGTLTNWVRVYPPDRILRDRDEWRERIGEYWFWKPGETGMTQTRALESVCIADTMDGDELVVHPDAPEEAILLPRHHDECFHTGSAFNEAITWLHESGRLIVPVSFYYFIPWTARLRVHGSGTGAEHAELVAAIQNTGLVTHRIDAPDEETAEDGPFTQLMLERVGGRLWIHDASRIVLDCDDDADDTLVSSITRALERMRCVVGEPERVPAS